MKLYKRRDSATAALKRLGVPRKAYDQFITTDKNGQFACDLDAARISLEPKTDKPKPIRQTITSFVQGLILDGLSNDEIYEKMKKKYPKDENMHKKKYYPTWYRGHLRRQGLLPPAFDGPNQDPTAVHLVED